MFISESLTSSETGFSIIELALAIAVIGLVFAVCTLAWTTTLEARRTGQNKTIITQLKGNILRQIITDETYPDVSSASNPSPAIFMREYLNGVANGLDAYGREIRLLEGIDGNALPLAARPAVDNPVRSWIAVRPGKASSVTDRHGRIIHDVAYVIISYGRDGQPDDASYGDILTSGRVATIRADAPPDFTRAHDDQYAILTWAEIAQAAGVRR